MRRDKVHPMSGFARRFSEYFEYSSFRSSEWFASMLACAFLLSNSCPSHATVIYSTGFEASEGYKTNIDLVGQNGWIGAGSGGNRIVSGLFRGKGQQAYIGIKPPVGGDSSLAVYQPITNKSLPHVQFSVTMALFDSTNTNYDDFYWAVF